MSRVDQTPNLHSRQKIVRVHWCATESNFIVQMGSGGPAGPARQRDHLAPPHLLAGDDQELRQMSIIGLDSVSMVYNQQLPVTAGPSLRGHHAIGSDANVCSMRRGNINPGMKCTFARKWVATDP